MDTFMPTDRRRREFSHPIRHRFIVTVTYAKSGPFAYMLPVTTENYGFTDRAAANSWFDMVSCERDVAHVVILGPDGDMVAEHSKR
jgi:hypothetical protein